MKTNPILIMAGLLAAALAACESEAIIPQQLHETGPEYEVLAAENQGGLCVDNSYHLHTYEISDNPGVPQYECVVPPPGCAKIAPCGSAPGGNKKGTEKDARNALRHFLRAVGKGHVTGFFHSVHWEVLFPQLQGNSEALAKLRSGQLEFSRKTNKDGSVFFIAVPKGSTGIDEGAGVVLEIPVLK